MAVKTTYSVSQGGQTTSDLLREAMQEALTANEQRRAQNELAWRNQVPGVNRQYDDLAQQAYASLLQNERSAANTLASSGLYNSGYGDTYRIAQRNAYGADLTAGQVARDDALRNIEASILSANAEAGAAAGDITSAYQQRIAEQTWAEQQYAKQIQQQELENAYYAAQQGDYRALQALGVDTTEMQRQRDLDIQMQQAQISAQRSSTASASNAQREAWEKEEAARKQDESYVIASNDVLKASGGDPAKAMSWILARQENLRISGIYDRMLALVDDMDKRPYLYAEYASGLGAGSGSGASTQPSTIRTAGSSAVGGRSGVLTWQ